MYNREEKMHAVNSLIEKIGTRSRRLEMMSESNFPISKPAGDEPVKLAWYEERGYLADDPILRGARGRVSTFERNVQTIGKSDMCGREKQAAIADQVNELIRSIEQLKTKAINEVMKQLDARIIYFNNQMKSSDASRQLLDYRRAELKYANLEPGAALGRLEIMARDGYTLPELETVASKSPDAQKRAAEIMNGLPPAVANPEGIALIEKLTALVSLPTGNVHFTVESCGAQVTQSAHVLELVSDPPTLRSIADLKLAPVAEPEPAA